MKKIDLRQLKHELRLNDLKHDPWGTALEAHFQVAAIMFDKGFDIPHHWQYRPAQTNGKQAETDSYWYSILIRLGERKLIEFGNLLERYERLLKLKGRDY